MIDFRPFVSVIICAHNEQHCVQDCLRSVIASTYENFELIFVDDASFDYTNAAANSLNDPRLRVIRNPGKLGPAAARNRGVSESSGSILFFTDADCIVSPNWIETVVDTFNNHPERVVGVEGSIYYETPELQFTHELPINPFYPKRAYPFMNVPAQDYATANIAFRRDAFLKSGGFNSSRYLFGREDTDLARRILIQGAIIFRPEAQVTHMASSWTWSKLQANAKRYSEDVKFFKDHKFFFFRCGRILHPWFLLLLVCPFLIPFHYQIRNLKDLNFATKFYAYLLMLRLQIWKQSLRDRVVIV